MKRIDKEKTIKELLIGFVVVLVAVVVVGAVEVRTVKVPEAALSVPISVEPVVDSAKSRIFLAGEVFWGRYMRDAAAKSELGYGFPFSGLASFEREKYDAWFGHMECPITNNSLTSKQQEATLTFNCRPEFLEEAAKWFDVMSLANNHTDNMGGQVGLDETRKNLGEHGLQYYGNYDNRVLDELCEVVDLPVRINYLLGEGDVEQFPIAMCGFHVVFTLPTPEQLDVIKDYSRYFLTIVTPHMGQEYVSLADQLKVDTYRAMIDRGADLVVASHPHWVQNTEVYKDKLIMYSVGNFMFDQQFDKEVRRGAALDLQIEITDANLLKSWLNVGFECGEFKDQCLELAQKLDLEKPEFILDYGVVSSLNTGYVTSLAPADVRRAVTARLNWEQTMKLLN